MPQFSEEQGCKEEVIEETLEEEASSIAISILRELCWSNGHEVC